MVYHRAPAFVEVYARVLKRLKDLFQTQNEVQVFTAPAAGRSSPPSRTSCGPASRRSWPRAASSASAGSSSARPTARRRSTGRPSGGARSTRPSSTGCSARTRRRARLHDLLRDLHRRGQRHPRAHRGRAQARRPDRCGRGVRPRRGPAPAGRVGRGRGGGRLPEGADGAAGTQLRQRERGGARARRGHPGPALLLRLGAHGERPAKGPAGQPVHPGGRARQGARRGARDDREPRVSSRSTSATRCSDAPRARRHGRSTSSCSAVLPTTTPTS